MLTSPLTRCSSVEPIKCTLFRSDLKYHKYIHVVTAAELMTQQTSTSNVLPLMKHAPTYNQLSADQTFQDTNDLCLSN